MKLVQNYFSVRVGVLIVAVVFFLVVMGAKNVYAFGPWTEHDDGFESGNWLVIRSSASGDELVGIFQDTTDDLYKVKYSEDGGESWEDITPNDPDVDDELELSPLADERHVWTDVAISSDGSAIALSDNNSIGGVSYVWYSPNAGGVWDKFNGDGQPGLGTWEEVSLGGSDGQYIGVSGNDGEDLLFSDDYGGTWADRAPGEDSWTHVAFSPSGSRLITTDADGDFFYKSSNQGLSWTDTASEGPNEAWTDIAAADNGTFIAAGGAGVPIYIYKTYNAGSAWYNTGHLSSTADKHVALSGDGTTFVGTDASGYVYFADTSNETETTYVNRPDVGSSQWNTIALNNDGTRAVVAGEDTEVWTYLASDDHEAPTVTSTSPADGATVRPTDTTITITFSEPMYPSLYVSLTCDAGSDSDCASYDDPAWSDDLTQATLTRSDGERFIAGDIYTFGIIGVDASINEMEEPYEWSFTVKRPQSSGGGTTAAGRIKNLREMGKDDEAEKIEQSIPTIQSAPSALPALTRLLKYTMTGEDVRTLQKSLNKKGFIISTLGVGSPGNESAYFGLKTLAQVKAFQKAHNLDSDGVVGPKTFAALEV